MPIFLDNHSIQTNASIQDVSPWTFAYNCTGSELYLAILVVRAATTAIATLTYNGVAATLKASEVLSALVDMQIDWWDLVAPATGSHNIVMTPSSGSPFSTMAGVSSWTGVDQTTPLGTKANTNVDAQTNEFVTASPNAQNGEVVLSIGCTYNKTMSMGVGTLLDTSNAFAAQGMSHGYKVAPKGLNAVENRYTWTGQGNQIAAEIAYPLRPSSYPPDASFRPNNLRPRIFAPGIAR